jgi:hypothetical protein
LDDIFRLLRGDEKQDSQLGGESASLSLSLDDRTTLRRSENLLSFLSPRESPGPERWWCCGSTGTETECCNS